MSKSTSFETRSSFNLSSASHQSLKRKWFIRQLIPQVGGLKYALLNLIPSIVECEAHDLRLNIAVKEGELTDWAAVCSSSPYVSNFVIETNNISTVIYLELEDQSLLELHLIHCIGRKGDIFSNSKKLLGQAEINEEGIKIAPHRYILEYKLISAYCDSLQNTSTFLKEYAILPFTQKVKKLRQISLTYQQILLEFQTNISLTPSSWKWLTNTQITKKRRLNW